MKSLFLAVAIGIVICSGAKALAEESEADLRLKASEMAKSFVSSGKILDQSGNKLTVVNGIIQVNTIHRVGKKFIVRLEIVDDQTAMGGYRNSCAGTVVVDAHSGMILSPEANKPSDFTCD